MGDRFWILDRVEDARRAYSQLESRPNWMSPTSSTGACSCSNAYNIQHTVYSIQHTAYSIQHTVVSQEYKNALMRVREVVGGLMTPDNMCVLLRELEIAGIGFNPFGDARAV